MVPSSVCSFHGITLINVSFSHLNKYGLQIFAHRCCRLKRQCPKSRANREHQSAPKIASVARQGVNWLLLYASQAGESREQCSPWASSRDV